MQLAYPVATMTPASMAQVSLSVATVIVLVVSVD
jgi:hypothetical protein